MRIAIIGGGAAGFMAAITAQSSDSSSEVILFEKSNKALSKVLMPELYLTKLFTTASLKPASNLSIFVS
ncbi:MAG: FAD-binding protein [Flavobacteriia bacterium]|nr:FAD-binding protein [Flavobacteriia bacterium]